jgi:hypothetical protein
MKWYNRFHSNKVYGSPLIGCLENMNIYVVWYQWFFFSIMQPQHWRGANIDSGRSLRYKCTWKWEQRSKFAAVSPDNWKIARVTINNQTNPYSPSDLRSLNGSINPEFQLLYDIFNHFNVHFCNLTPEMKCVSFTDILLFIRNVCFAL